MKRPVVASIGEAFEIEGRVCQPDRRDDDVTREKRQHLDLKVNFIERREMTLLRLAGTPDRTACVREGHETSRTGANMATCSASGAGYMNASVVSALAALVGAAIGGLTSVLASWLTQRTQVRAEWLAHDRARRQDLYKDFIEEATKCYVDALQHKDPDLSTLGSLYAKISRMRVQSTRAVANEADQIGRKIVDAYLAPGKNFVEIRAMLEDGSIDILGKFGDACREEFDSLRAQQF